MGLTRLRYLLLVLFILSGRPSSGQEAAVTHLTDHPASALFLSQYIQIPSVSGNEKQAGEFFAQACRDRGLHVHIFTSEQDSYNFAASLYPLELEKPGILFLTHIDVVPEGDADLWKYPPFAGVIADGQVWGRGAFDNKGHGVMQFFALASFVEEAALSDLPYNFIMLAVSGEETDGMPGAGLIVEKYLHQLYPAVVYGEGGIGCSGIVKAAPEQVLFGVEVAQKRALWLKLETSGTNFGHGSVPVAAYPARELTLATNAILNIRRKPVLSPLVLNMLNDIGSHENGIRKLALQKFRLFSPFIGRKVSQEELINALLHNTITLTGVWSSAGAYNQMSQAAWATFDVRLLPETSSEDFLRKLRQTIRKYDVDLSVIKEGPPSPVSVTGPFYYALEQAIYENFEDVTVSPMLMPASNDNLFFRAKGIPAYGLVPAVFDQEHVRSIHNINERIPLTALEQGIAVYQSLIRILSTRLYAGE